MSSRVLQFPQITNVRKAALIAICLGALCLYGFWYFKLREPNERLSCLGVAQFGVGGMPCFDVEIGQKKVVFGLDLGLDADLSATKELTQNIKDKSFVKTVSMNGIRGGIYEENIYQVPSFKIGRLTTHNRFLNEENAAWEQESTIIHKKDPNVLHPPGRMGWRLFLGITVFLDLKNGKMILAASIEDFFKKKHSLEGFTKTAFLIDHGFIEFIGQTPQGPLRCILDSGCTSNLIHGENLNDEPLAKLITDESRFIQVDLFSIGGYNCGPITFRPIPIQFQTPVNVILGMEFLLNHQVFIDFPHQEIYFSSSEEVSQLK